MTAPRTYIEDPFDWLPGFGVAFATDPFAPGESGRWDWVLKFEGFGRVHPQFGRVLVYWLSPEGFRPGVIFESLPVVARGDRWETNSPSMRLCPLLRAAIDNPDLVAEALVGTEWEGNDPFAGVSVFKYA